VRLQHPPDFGKDVFKGFNVFEHLGADHDVKRVALKGKLQRVSDMPFGHDIVGRLAWWEVVQGLTRLCQGRLITINPDNIHVAERVQRMHMTAFATAEVEHVVAWL
jgi:hypothetical protein